MIKLLLILVIALFAYIAHEIIQWVFRRSNNFIARIGLIIAYMFWLVVFGTFILVALHY